MLQTELRNSRILLLDRDTKTKEDRTWCFWEAEDGPFQEIVHHQWQQLWFHNSNFSRQLDIAPYHYKMIRSLDYYEFTNACFEKYTNVEQQVASISNIKNEGDRVKVSTEQGDYWANWCIDTLPNVKIDRTNSHYLDQHFRGWFIKTKKAVFDSQVATLMDFRVPQLDDFRFVYVMPTSSNEALVEFTLFANNYFTDEEYDQKIGKYLKEYWPDLGSFEIMRTEQGSIPMTDFQFPKGQDRIIKLGAAGGDTRASTGYTFVNIHRRVQRVVSALVSGKQIPTTSLAQKRHHLYDSLMLRVLQHGRYPGDKLFGELFEKNPPKRLLRFLNGESHLLEELALMSTTPIPIFLRVLGEKIAGALPQPTTPTEDQ